ncbi:MBL fold metallo-hydrolase [Lysinibacillus sp. NPDC093210]|uniref:MBL fold metallo-hydrolase n=1 Tax=Lysinibacillus sp. NPDC093210 TaxID=3364133 RepID=UPI00382E2C6B
MKTANIMFFERPFPSANSIVIQDDQTFLVDTGFGSDVLQAEKILSDAGIFPKQLNSIINTHYHSDHVGGNHYFQQRYDLPIAAHLWEGEMVNQCDLESCGSQYLDQPVEQYVTNR